MPKTVLKYVERWQDVMRQRDDGSERGMAEDHGGAPFL